MKRWMVEFDCESEFLIEKGAGTLRYAHPDGSFEAEVTNRHVPKGWEPGLLRIVVVFHHADENELLEVVETHLSRFLSQLSFMVGSPIRDPRPIRIMDWSKGVERRDCILFKRYPNPNFPIQHLNQDYLTQLEVLFNPAPDKSVMKALRWFSHGINNLYPEDQFQNFWFSVETLALRHKGSEKDPSLCPSCRGALSCPSCSTPLYRPFPRQAIEALLRRNVPAKTELMDRIVRDLFKARNSLLHGTFATEIEKSIGVPFQQMVDVLGHAAWNEMLKSFKPSAKEFKLSISQPNSKRSTVPG